MKAMMIEQFGGPEAFGESVLPVPELRSGHVLIRVQATSVNPVDCLIRGMGPPFAPALPATLHGDVAGVVAAVAEDVTGFAPGDEVYGCAGGVQGLGGALAEFMLADAALIAHKPSILSMREAAALPLVTITAWEGLFQRVALPAGAQVLIHGGAGGVGHVAVQLARHAGLHVTATVSSDAKADIARSLGADEVVNYREEGVASYVERITGGRGYELVFDTVGGGNLPTAFEAAKIGGAVVTTVALGPLDLTLAHMKGLSLHIIFMLIPLIHNLRREGHGQILARAAQLADRGELRPLLDPHLFDVREVADAHRLLEDGAAVGKLVLEWR